MFFCRYFLKLFSSDCRIQKQHNLKITFMQHSFNISQIKPNCTVEMDSIF